MISQPYNPAAAADTSHAPPSAASISSSRTSTPPHRLRRQLGHVSSPPAPMIPPPYNRAAVADTSHALPSAASSFSSRRGLTIRLHPFVVGNIFEHHTRVKDQSAASSSSSGATAAQPQRMFGCVIGVQRKQMVEIFNSFELVLDPVSGTLDRSFFEKEEFFKKVFPDLYVLGWYSIGSDVQDADMEVHKALMDVNERGLYLLLNPAINLSQTDLRMSIYESELHVIDGSPELIFVRSSNITIETVKAETISVDHGANLRPSLGPSRAAEPAEQEQICLMSGSPDHPGLPLSYGTKVPSTEALAPATSVLQKSTLLTAPEHSHVRKTTFDVTSLPLEEGEDAKFKRWAFRRVLLETPSGFAMFGVDEKLFTHSEDIWSWFTDISDAHDVIFRLGFIKVDNKSIARDSAVGPGKDLTQFIQKFCNRKALIVQDLQLRNVIEANLGVPCYFDEHIVHELSWGLNYVLNEFVPEEKENLTNEGYPPLSKELEKKIKTYGFNISPRMIDREFIRIVGYLDYIEYTSEVLSKLLHDKFDRYFGEIGISNDLEFAEALASIRDSSEASMEMLPKDDMYSKGDILRYINAFLAFPQEKNYAMSCLKRKVAASEGNVGFLKRHPWVKYFGFGCGIAMAMVFAEKSEAAKSK